MGYRGQYGWGWLVLWLFSSAVLAADAASPVPDARVARAIFTTGIVDREPVDELAELPADAGEVYFFTELRGLEGRTVSHRWEYEGRVMAEVPFAVGGDRWRVYSVKTMSPALVGKWTVMVVDESGWPVDAGVLDVTPLATP